MRRVGSAIAADTTAPTVLTVVRGRGRDCRSQLVISLSPGRLHGPRSGALGGAEARIKTDCYTLSTINLYVSAPSSRRLRARARRGAWRRPPGHRARRRRTPCYRLSAGARPATPQRPTGTAAAPAARTSWHANGQAHVPTVRWRRRQRGVAYRYGRQPSPARTRRAPRRRRGRSSLDSSTKCSLTRRVGGTDKVEHGGHRIIGIASV